MSGTRGCHQDGSCSINPCDVTKGQFQAMCLLLTGQENMIEGKHQETFKVNNPQTSTITRVALGWSPCASSNQSLPVVAAAVDVDVPHDAVAAVAGEALLTVALLGRRLISLHRQIVVRQPQFPVRRLWIQLEWLTLKISNKFQYAQILNGNTVVNVFFFF